MSEVLAEGARITPEITLIREIGKGAMGSVWLARQGARDVVVKFIADHATGNEESIARFRREATSAAQVQGAHVVTIYEHGLTLGGRPFIAMELLEGEDLGARIDREGVLLPRDVVEIVRQICVALMRIHAAGIVHRDIKAQNVFLCRGPAIHVKLLDFGVAKGGDNLQMTATGATLGTPQYMSPEQCIGVKELDGRSDVWAVGVLAYFMLTGKWPFNGKTIQQLTLAIFHAEIVPPTTIHRELPPALDTWFAKACARDRDLRYATAQELADALAAVFPKPPRSIGVYILIAAAIAGVLVGILLAR
jgi:eukaryotic-like serine/threonine-protein kinase